MQSASRAILASSSVMWSSPNPRATAHGAVGSRRTTHVCAVRRAAEPHPQKLRHPERRRANDLLSYQDLRRAVAEGPSPSLNSILAARKSYFFMAATLQLDNGCSGRRSRYPPHLGGPATTGVPALSGRPAKAGRRRSPENGAFSFANGELPQGYRTRPFFPAATAATASPCGYRCQRGL